MMSFIFVLLLHFNYVLCFNIDTNFPIVYIDPVTSLDKKPDLISSYFGYSVVLHSESSLENSWIQIGAPRAYSTINLKEQGTVFRCKIFGPCHSINVHPYVTNQNSFKDKKDGAWIGGAMDIDEPSGRVVVCGHRFINDYKGFDYWMVGACYWSHVNDTASEKLVPLTGRDNALKNINLASGNSKATVYYYAQGQAGFSAHFSASKEGPELLLGAPGVYNWVGTALIYKDSDTTPIVSATSFEEFPQLNIANAILTAQSHSFGLFGYAVTSGYFFNKNKLLYVSGAPRSKTYMGEILIFKFSKKSDSALDVKDRKQGHQLGEYFGAALTAGDINEDGYDDLIIGAPFYRNHKYNEGRIFVFLGSSKGSLDIPQQNSIIQGSAVGAQFGSGLVFLGDLHRDGYGDVAVAAPYENEGSGVVYIYRGNPLGLDSKYSQKINGKSFEPNIKGFGISMSKPADIDGNSYKDLAVGAYVSGHAVLLRSRPVVTLKQTLIALTPHLDHNAKTFEIKSCLWYEGADLQPPINITRKIILDELFHRLYLPKDVANVQSISLNNNNNTVCQDITIFLKNITSNRSNPVTVTVSQELQNIEIVPQILYVKDDIPTQQDKFCKHCPVLNDNRSIRETTIELSFALVCGHDSICQSRLNL